MESPFWRTSHLAGLGAQLRNFRVAGSSGGRAHIRERNAVSDWRSRKSRGAATNCPSLTSPTFEMLLLVLCWLKEASSLPSNQYYEGSYLCFGFMNTLYLHQIVLLLSSDTKRLTAFIQPLCSSGLNFFFPELAGENEVGRGMVGRKIFFVRVIGRPANNPR